MLALKINTTKTFMHKLLIGDAFHVFFTCRGIYYNL